VVYSQRIDFGLEIDESCDPYGVKPPEVYHVASCRGSGVAEWEMPRGNTLATWIGVFSAQYFNQREAAAIH